MSKGISETAFASQVEDLFNIFHWRWIHFRPAWSARGYRTPIRGGDPDGYKGKGFPDYVAVRGHRLIFAELKDQYSKPTPEQEAWLEGLRECQKWLTTEPVVYLRGKALIPDKGEAELGKNFKLTLSLEVYLWRPSQFDEIMEVLR